MSKAQDRGQYDWLVELTGAFVLAGAAAFAAGKLAPVNGWSVPVCVAVAGLAALVAGLAIMRVIPPKQRRLAVAPFEPLPLEEELLLDQPIALGELLLDQALVADGMEAVAELLLDDPLPPSAPDSRVVQLFADGRMPSAGQMQERIVQHLAKQPGNRAPADASDQLVEALAELRRSIRQA